MLRNQFLITYLKHFNIDYKVQKKLVGVDRNGSSIGVTPTLQLKFQGNGEQVSVDFLVEVLREYAGWETEYAEKLIRYAGYLESVQDTQALKKYFIIVCAESQKQIHNAVQIFYELCYKRRVRAVQNIKIYYISDENTLDIDPEIRVLDRLQGFEYNSTSQKWEENKFEEFMFEERDWHEIPFEKESYADSCEEPDEIGSDSGTTGDFRDGEEEDEKKRICD